VHVQIINFNLKGIGEEDYRKQVEAIAPAFANLPGLVSKTWLANPQTNTYGGVYLWRDREAMENYARTDIYQGMLANPYFGDVTTKDFGILDHPTSITRGLGEAAA
jgi:heme-degrading monooxygenase HmoA